MYYEMKYDLWCRRLTIASDGSNLAGLWMEGQKYWRHCDGELHPCGSCQYFPDKADWLDRYFPEKGRSRRSAMLAPIGRRIPADGVGTAL